jgi:hypothetical protein
VAKLASPVVKSATEYAANDAALVSTEIKLLSTKCVIGIISFALEFVSVYWTQAATASTNEW